MHGTKNIFILPSFSLVSNVFFRSIVRKNWSEIESTRSEKFLIEIQVKPDELRLHFYAFVNFATHFTTFELNDVMTRNSTKRQRKNTRIVLSLVHMYCIFCNTRLVKFTHVRNYTSIRQVIFSL